MAKIKVACFFLGHGVYTGWSRKDVPNFRMALCKQSRWSESAEKRVCNEQTSSNVSIKFHLKRFLI